MDQYRTLFGIACSASFLITAINLMFVPKSELMASRDETLYCSVEMNRQLDVLEERVNLYLNVYKDILAPHLESATD